jgi:hypothetical protein
MGRAGYGGPVLSAGQLWIDGPVWPQHPEALCGATGDKNLSLERLVG